MKIIAESDNLILFINQMHDFALFSVKISLLLVVCLVFLCILFVLLSTIFQATIIPLTMTLARVLKSKITLLIIIWTSYPFLPNQAISNKLLVIHVALKFWSYNSLSNNIVMNYAIYIIFSVRQCSISCDIQEPYTVLSWSPSVGSCHSLPCELSRYGECW